MAGSSGASRAVVMAVASSTWVVDAEAGSSAPWSRKASRRSRDNRNLVQKGLVLGGQITEISLVPRTIFLFLFRLPCPMGCSDDSQGSTGSQFTNPRLLLSSMVGENEALVISRTRNGSNSVLDRDRLQSKPGSVNTERQLTRGTGRRAAGNARDVSGSSNNVILRKHKKRLQLIM